MTEQASEQSIFLHALGLTSPAERAAYLDEVCQGKPELRAGLDALLAAHDRLGGDLPLTTGEEAAAFNPAESPRSVFGGEGGEGVGAVLSGRYKLVEQIGEGGMGTVWMAQQTEPVRRAVAVKLIKLGMDSKQVLARFEAERQALALMDHPNIARVLDAGTTASGRPYFVMELVKGVPLTKYCDEHRRTPRQRLELFVSVCQAVQHAHQKGIIHRDIKPSNILVAQYDGRPVPKVIDFGIAKAAGQQLTDKTLLTGFGAVVGTLEYMSPEQAESNQLDIDTRTDIYSLGVVLYELLTGSTPLDKKRLKQAALVELLRIIREEEPQKPSTRLSGSAEALPSISAQRQMEPAKLTKLVRGELDWLVMKALEKDRNRRYETANGFAMDIQRYLADEPVQACPPSAGYRLRKFARRNKGRLAVAVMVLFFLVSLGGVGGWVVWNQAAKQRETEEGVTTALSQAEVFLAEGDRETDNPARWQATVGLAEAAGQRAEELLTLGSATADLAERVRQVREAVAAARADSGLLVEFERIALEKAAVHLGHFDTVRPTLRYAALLRDYGVNPASPEEAAERVRGSRVREALLSALEDWRRATSDPVEKQQLATVLRAGEPVSDAFRQRWWAAKGRGDGATLAQLARDPAVQGLPAATLVMLASDLRNGKEYAAAERLLRAGLERHRDNFWLNHDLGMVLEEQRPTRREEAVAYLTAAVALRSDSPGVHLNLGLALKGKKDLGGAIREYQTALRIDPNYVAAHNNLGLALIDKKDVEGAVRTLQRALRIDPKDPQVHINLGFALLKKKDPDGAIRECRNALTLDPRSAAAHNTLGLALLDKKDLEGAIREFQSALTINSEYVNAHAHHNLGVALQKRKDLDGAVREYRVAIALEPDNAVFHKSLGNALLARKDLTGAIRECQAALLIDPEYALGHVGLGLALRAKGDLEGAIRECQAALRIDPNEILAHNALGLVLRDQKNPEGAIREFQTALTIDPEFAEAHNNLGVVLLQKNDLEEAIREFRSAIAIDSNHVLAHLNLADALSASKDFEGALREFQTAIQIDPRNAKAHGKLGNFLRDWNVLEGAIREYREAISLDANDAVTHHALGHALHYGAKKDLDGAIKEYKAALAIEPNRAWAVYDLGVALYEKKDPEGAIRQYEAAIKIDPSLALPHYALGFALMNKGDLEGAIRQYRAAIKLDPNAAAAHNELGRALFGIGDLAEAIVAYQKAIALRPKYAEAHCNLGQALRRLGAFRQSLEAYRRGHELGSKNPDWRYPSLQWVRDSEHLVELDRQLPSLLIGTTMPASAAEGIEVAEFCSLKQLHRAAARFYEQAFTLDPRLADTTTTINRYNAACAAALAGCGQGKDADKLDGEERSRLRRQALDWLRADQEAWSRMLDKERDKARPVVLQQMQHWLEDTDLAGVRGPAALAKLPDAERQPWQDLWGHVNVTLARALDRTIPENKSDAK